MDYNTYNVLQPPFTLRFREMSRQELKDYFRWFLDMIPARIVEVSDAVRRTPGYEGWQPNNMPDSLDVLGRWLFNNVETRPRTKEEIAEINNRLAFPVEISNSELTDKTFSLAIDVGMYLSHVFLDNHHSLKWHQIFVDRRSIDYGQPVLCKFACGPFTVIRFRSRSR